MYYFCFENQQKVKFVNAGRFVAVKPNLHPKRKLKDAVLLFGYEGECAIAQDGREYILRKGDCMLLFPNHTHYGVKHSTVGQSHFWCHFNLGDCFTESQAESILDLKSEGHCILPEFAHIKNFEKIFILFSQLIDSAQTDNQNCVITECFLKILLCSVSEELIFENSMHRPKVSSKLKELVYFKRFRDISVEQVARELNYNPNYLARIIKKETGLSPVEFINVIKIKHAKSLLINSNMRMSQIAESCGFADEKYFLKVFKKYENITAGQYRNAYFRKNLNDA